MRATDLKCIQVFFSKNTKLHRVRGVVLLVELQLWYLIAMIDGIAKEIKVSNQDREQPKQLLHGGRGWCV